MTATTARTTPVPPPQPPANRRRKRSWPHRRISSRMGGCGPPGRPHGLLPPPPHGPPPPPWFHDISWPSCAASHHCQPPDISYMTAIPRRDRWARNASRYGCAPRKSRTRGRPGMSRLSEERVLAALRQIMDPDRGQDIVSLGMVTGLQLREGHVGFAIEVDPQRGPKLEPLRKAAEKAVEAL